MTESSSVYVPPEEVLLYTSYPVMALFVPPLAPLQDNVTDELGTGVEFDTETFSGKEHAVGMVYSIVMYGVVD